MSKRQAKHVPPTGELRQSQLLTTFGPGSMVDLPNHAVLIGGLDHWQFAERKRIYEDRLERRLCDLLALEELTLYEPPVDNNDPTAPRSGVTVFLFPAWFLAQVEETYKAPDGRVYRARPLIPWDRLVKGGYLNRDRKIVPVVPIRFVQACVKGHISDIDWYAFVRETYTHDRAGQLWFDEGGAGNDFTEIYVRDERNDNRRRPLSDATVPGARILGTCQGRKPWLGPRVRDGVRGTEPPPHPFGLERLLLADVERDPYPRRRGRTEGGGGHGVRGLPAVLRKRRGRDPRAPQAAGPDRARRPQRRGGLGGYPTSKERVPRPRPAASNRRSSRR